MSSHGLDRIVGQTGVVKWFDPKKGFGFIVGPESQDIFVHYTKIEGDGFRVLRDGTQVNYDAERGETGWRATRVRRPDEPVVEGAAVGGPEGVEVTVRKTKPALRTPRR
jgi:CspA family cold shock protein